MSELLFEGYDVPAVAYGIDSLFSMYKNNIGDTALIVNCGYHTIHIIPVLRGQVIEEHARRINLGKQYYYCHSGRSWTGFYNKATHHIGPKES